MKTIAKSRIEVLGTGNQAPYGIDEIIATYAPTRAGLKKAFRRAAYWYNQAAVIVDGERVDAMDYFGQEEIIRDCDLGYAID